MCCNHLAVALQFTVAGAVSPQTGQFGFAVVPTRSCLQHILEGSGMPLPSHLNPDVLTVSQNGSVRRFGPSHTCVSIQRSLMLYVYCFEFMLLASRLQSISRMSFPLLPSPPAHHTKQDRASNNPSRCFIFAVHSECRQYYFFSFLLPWLCCCKNKHFFSLYSMSNCLTHHSLTLFHTF